MWWWWFMVAKACQGYLNWFAWIVIQLFVYKG
jgi:hypothetical protein